MANSVMLYEVHSFPPHLIHVNALLCNADVANCYITL